MDVWKVPSASPCQAPQPMVRQVPWILFELRSWAKWLPKNKSPTFHAKSSQARLHCQTNPSTNFHWMANLDVGVTPIQFARDWMVVPIPLLCGIWTRPAACSSMIFWASTAACSLPIRWIIQLWISHSFTLSSTIRGHIEIASQDPSSEDAAMAPAPPRQELKHSSAKSEFRRPYHLMQSCTKNGLLINRYLMLIIS